MNRRLISSLLIAGLLVWVGGCSKNPAEPEASGLNLSEEFGGYLAADEAVGFADSDLLAEEAENKEFNDPIKLSPRYDSLIYNRDAGFYHLRAVWGQLRFDPDVQDITDWSGSITVSRGMIVIKRAIRFEPGQDYILPRVQRNLVEWVSKTTVHNDGIAVDILVPPLRPHDDPGDDTVRVTIQAGEYSRTFTLIELRELDTVVYFDNSNGIALHAFRINQQHCKVGFLAGRWGVDDEGRNRFRGVWMYEDGRTKGFLRGHFGVNDEGRKLFFGKLIGFHGEFVAFLRGTFGYRPDETDGEIADGNAGGWFTGHIINADRIEIGVMRGRFHSSWEHDGGFFQGGWRLHCDNWHPDYTDTGDGS